MSNPKKLWPPISSCLKALGVTLGAVILGIGGCGISPPQPETKSGGSVELPPFPLPVDSADKEGNFGLTDHDGTQVYDGRLIFWDERATPDAVAAVNKSTVDGRKVKAAALVFAQSELIPAEKIRTQAQTQVDEAQSLILQAEQHALRDRENLAKARSAFLPWFSQTMERLEQREPFLKNERPLIDARWQAYCDGKLWEMATSSLSLQTWNERPSPLILCESYYEARGYFQNPRHCGPHPKGRSYFTCLWSEGTLKTPQWHAVVDDPSTAKCAVTQRPKKDVVAGWLEEREKNFVQNSSDPNMDHHVSPSSSPLEELLRDEPTRLLFADTIMGGRRLSKAVFSEKTMELLGQCATAFEKKGGFETTRLEHAAPQRLLWIVEHTFPGNLTSKEPLLPLRGEGTRHNDRLLYTELTSFIKRLGQRFSQPQGLKVSVSDLLFNEPRNSPLPQSSLKNEEGESLESSWNFIFPKDLEKADPTMRILLKDLTEKTRPLTEALSLAKNHLHDKMILFKNKKDLFDQFLRGEQEATTSGLRAVNQPEATVFFATFRLKLTRQNKVLFVEWTVDEPLTQCVVLEEGGICPASTASGPLPLGMFHSELTVRKMEPDLKVTFDPPSNRLTLDLTVRDPYRYGMRELPRTRENLAQAKESPLLRFNDVPAPTWYNRTLHLEFYGAKLEGILDIFSGNAFLQDGEKKILQGSLTGDRFDQAYRQLQL